MKKIVILLAAAAVAMTGCNKFLDVKPVGARFLEDLESVASTMGSWMYVFQQNGKYVSSDSPKPWIPLQHGTFSSDFLIYADVWSFADFNDEWEDFTTDEKRNVDRGIFREDWDRYYELVGFMNLIITEGTKADGDQTLRDVILGEAYIQRAYYLFKLLQYYAPVDDAATGIPVYLDIDKPLDEADLSRKSQPEVYRQIFADLERAETILSRTKPDPEFNIMFSGDWIYRIAAQIYHWKASTAAGQPGDWDQAVKYSEMALKAPGVNGQMVLPFDMDRINSDEVFSKNLVTRESHSGFEWGQGYPETLGINYNWSNFISNFYNYSLDVWRNLYVDGDRRKKEWFLVASRWDTPSDKITESQISCSRKVGRTANNLYPNIFLMRLSEQWLIRTEALALSGKVTEAQEALSTWRSLRYSPDAVLPMPAGAEDIQHEVYLERKREFLGEGDILWLDMKRFHVSETRRVLDFTATLEGDDFRYQFPIPQSELDNNKSHITANPGWDQLIYY